MTEEQRKASDWLNRAHNVDDAIKALERVQEKNRSIAERCTASFDEKGSTGTGKDNSQERILHQLCDDNAKIESRIRELIQIRVEVRNAIHSVESEKIEAVLNMRYLAYMRIDDIASDLGIDRKTVNRRHLKGLEIIHEKIKNGY